MASQLGGQPLHDIHNNDSANLREPFLYVIIVSYRTEGERMNTEDLPASLEVSGNLKKLVEYVSGGAKAVYLTNEGRSVAVLLDIDYFNALLDAVDSIDSSLDEDKAGMMEDILKRYNFKSRMHRA